MKKLMLATAALLLVGCQTFYSSIVTVTQVRNDVMTELAVLYKQGRISPATDTKIGEADQQFRTAASALEQALLAYKAGTGEKPSLAEVKVPVAKLIQIAAPYVTQAITSQNSDNLQKATQL